MEGNSFSGSKYLNHCYAIASAESPPSADDIIELENAIHDSYGLQHSGCSFSSKNDYTKLCFDFGNEEQDSTGLHKITSYLFIDCETWGARQNIDCSRIEINILDLSDDRAVDLKGIKTRVVINRSGLVVENCTYMMRPIVVTKLGELVFEQPEFSTEEFDGSEAQDRTLCKYDIEFLINLIKTKLNTLIDSHDIYNRIVNN